MAWAQRGFVRYVYRILVINTHVFISGSVCALGFKEALVCSLLNMDRYPSPITNKGIGTNIYIQVVLGPVREGSFIWSVRRKYIYQTTLGRDGAIKTHF